MLFYNYLRSIVGSSILVRTYRHFIMNKRYKAKRTAVGMNVVLKNSILGSDIFIGDNSAIFNSQLGDHTYVNSNSRINLSKIGKFCSIASNVHIGVGAHPTNFVSTHPTFYANNKPFKTFADKMYFTEESGAIEIGNDVWIGSNSVILNNCRIGDGAIVALGSVVTKDVPPYAIVGGVPAKLIKYRFTEKDIIELLKIQWWNKSDSFLSHNFKDFHNVGLFIQKYLKSDRAN